MNEECFKLIVENLLKGEQVLVFVHTRNETTNLANDFVYHLQQYERNLMAEVNSKFLSNL